MNGADPTLKAVARVSAVVVDFRAGSVLHGCLRSLLATGVNEVVVVDNAAERYDETSLPADEHASVLVVRPGRNLGYGAGVNRGVAATRRPVGSGVTRDYVLVCNPDVIVHPGTVSGLVSTLDAEGSLAIVGPRVEGRGGELYPSARTFPSIVDAAGHAVFSQLWPKNPFTRRYRALPSDDSDVSRVEWVSGACFLVRRSAFEEVGGFDERYFMYAEDMDLCWRLHEAGWGVGYRRGIAVTHEGGVTTGQEPLKMQVAHHISSLRFWYRTTKGWRRFAFPIAAVLLGTRLAVVSITSAVVHRSS